MFSNSQVPFKECAVPEEFANLFAGKDLKKATVALEKEFRKDAKKKGVDPKKHAEDLLKQYGIR